MLRFCVSYLPKNMYVQKRKGSTANMESYQKKEVILPHYYQHFLLESTMKSLNWTIV